MGVAPHSWPPAGAAEYTAEVWFKLAPEDHGVATSAVGASRFPMRLMSKQRSLSLRLVRHAASGEVRVQAGHWPDKDGVMGRTAIEPGRWYHAAAVKRRGNADGTVLSSHVIFLDGVEDGGRRWERSSTRGGSGPGKGKGKGKGKRDADEKLLGGGRAMLTLGSLSLHTERFHGVIADARLWSTARTAAQLHAHRRLRVCGGSGRAGEILSAVELLVPGQRQTGQALLGAALPFCCSIRDRWPPC